MSTASGSEKPADPLTDAAMAVAIVIALNKPIYPVYVWWLAPDALTASLWTMLSLPFYAALPLLARRAPKWARLGLVVVGTIDTAAIGAVLGDGTGAWLFLLACLVLAGASFDASQTWTKRLAIAGVFAVFAATFGRFATPLAGDISPESVATLFKLNAFGAASLIAFIGLRYPSLR